MPASDTSRIATHPRNCSHDRYPCSLPSWPAADVLGRLFSLHPLLAAALLPLRKFRLNRRSHPLEDRPGNRCQRPLAHIRAHLAWERHRGLEPGTNVISHHSAECEVLRGIPSMLRPGRANTAQTGGGFWTGTEPSVQATAAPPVDGWGSTRRAAPRPCAMSPVIRPNQSGREQTSPPDWFDSVAGTSPSPGAASFRCRATIRAPERPGVATTPGVCRSSIYVVRIHDLRHSAASLLIAEGVELVELSMLLGHSELRARRICTRTCRSRRRRKPPGAWTLC